MTKMWCGEMGLAVMGWGGAGWVGMVLCGVGEHGWLDQWL